MKMVAPPELGPINVGDQTYTPDGDGMLHNVHGDHVGTLKQLGAKPYDPDVHGRAATSLVGTLETFEDPAMAEQVSALIKENDDFRTANSALKDENVSLNQRVTVLTDQVAALEERLEAAGGASGTEGGTTASDDTSGGQGGTGEEPALDDMSRDQLVEYVNANGGSIAANVSKDVALAAAKDVAGKGE